MEIMHPALLQSSIFYTHCGSSTVDYLRLRNESLEQAECCSNNCVKEEKGLLRVVRDVSRSYLAPIYSSSQQHNLDPERF